MGSKRAMLKNGLGEILGKEVIGRSRFVDLFSGSSSVSWFVAQQNEVSVVAVDLQLYGAVLANAVLARTKALIPEDLWLCWKTRAQELVMAANAPAIVKVTQASVLAARLWATWFPEGSLVQAYAGHYYSPLQAVWIEALRTTIPIDEPHHSVCLAALIIAASRSAAAPGHTAQPFQPTKTAKQFLESSWQRDVPALVLAALQDLTKRHAQSVGFGIRQDANTYAAELKPGDLVFVDPPYSGVHYSRFYHVLECIAEGETTVVSGVGRYPAPSKRPRSDYSMKTTSSDAMKDLLRTLANRGTDVILTFPDHECSNGLSGEKIVEIAADYFTVDKHAVKSVFSTLGGVTGEIPGTRKARQNASELILILRSK